MSGNVKVLEKAKLNNQPHNAPVDDFLYEKINSKRKH